MVMHPFIMLTQEENLSHILSVLLHRGTFKYNIVPGTLRQTYLRFKAVHTSCFVDEQHCSFELPLAKYVINKGV